MKYIQNVYDDKLKRKKTSWSQVFQTYHILLLERSLTLIISYQLQSPPIGKENDTKTRPKEQTTQRHSRLIMPIKFHQPLYKKGRTTISRTRTRTRPKKSSISHQSIPHKNKRTKEGSTHISNRSVTPVNLNHPLYKNQITIVGLYLQKRHNHKQRLDWSLIPIN